VRSATAIALLLLFGCASQPRLPDGVRVVPLEAPPPTADEVREAQERLTALGVYDGQVNGELGARTRVALARFQRIAGLTPTGRLDAPTMEALERASTAPRAAVAGAKARPVPAPALPSAAELLAEEGAGLPQPPAGALCDRLAEARAILESARGAAAVQLAVGAPPDGVAAAGRIGAGDPSVATAAGGRSAGGGPAASGASGAKAVGEPGGNAPSAGDSGTAATAEELRSAQQRLAAAREEAFDRMLEARREGGWALLPEALALEVERELARRALLLREPDGRLGLDTAAAIGWVQRSHGQTPTGEPTLGVMEILGIDPAPMFEEEVACAPLNRR